MSSAATACRDAPKVGASVHEDDDVLCSVCFMEPEVGDDGSKGRMASCGAGHHVCRDCAGSFLQSSLASPSQALLRQWKDSKTLPCPLSDKASPCCLTSRAFFEVGCADVSQAMCDLSESLSSTAAQQEVMTRMIKNESDKAAGGESSESARLVQHIKERIDDLCTASIACPHCKAPFVDFSGCMALSCAACGREFCGVCLSIPHFDLVASTSRRVPVTDAHAQVLLCLKRYDPKMLAQYGMSHGNYFISNAEGTNWERWKDRLKASRLLEYLFTIKKDVLWRVYDSVERHIVANKLMNEEEIGQLRAKVFSHEASAQHLVRIPVLFWLMYASKHDCSFREAMEDADGFMEQQDKIEVGRLCVAKMREVYPSWQAVRVRVPGESFEAINYPPEALALITSVIDEWGARKGIWSGVGCDASAAKAKVVREGAAHAAAPPAPVAAAAAAAAPAPRGGAGGGRGGRGGGGVFRGGRGGGAHRQ